MAVSPVAVCGVEQSAADHADRAVSGKLNPTSTWSTLSTAASSTVFAPTDRRRRQAVTRRRWETLKTNSDLLTSILTYTWFPARSPRRSGRHPQDR